LIGMRRGELRNSEFSMSRPYPRLSVRNGFNFLHYFSNARSSNHPLFAKTPCGVVHYVCQVRLHICARGVYRSYDNPRKARRRLYTR
jgi:hypothetical protein